MAEQTNEQPTAAKEVRKFSKAQAKRFNDLQGTAQRAQTAFQEFVNYLAEEHELAEGEQWVIGTSGFERAKSEPPAPQVEVGPQE